MRDPVLVACSIASLAAAPHPLALPSSLGPAVPTPVTDTVGHHVRGARRPLRPGDLYRLRDVRDPQRSPDGQWVAYTVSTADSAKDKGHTEIWMVSWDGGQRLPLTTGSASASKPRWSPDGAYLGFVSARDDSDETAQLWVLNRKGGEGQQLTHFVGDVEDYAWSPDGARIAVVVDDDPDDVSADSTIKDTTAAKHGGKSKKPKPIVIDRYQFKQDVIGYLGKKREHLYLVDVATKRAQILTPDAYDDADPAWSPDGTRIAFVSKRAPTDVDRADNWDIYVLDARPGAVPRQLTTWPGPDNPPDAGPLAWSPDGKSIAYVRGGADPRYSAYDQAELAIIEAAGGSAATTPIRGLDRPVSHPAWSRDGSSVTVLVEDDRSAYPMRVDLRSGALIRLLPGKLVVTSPSLGADGAITALVSTDSQPADVYAIADGTARQLTHENDAWLADIQLGQTQDFASRSRDGTDVHGVLVTPPGYVAGRRYPTLLRIHGGPNGQDGHEFSFEWQLFAGQGYVVAAVNYRGSSGRGLAYQRAIVADWGHKEVIDLLGATDHLVAAGIADSTRLGIGGWSYGGILTDYTIATTHRFRAATSGAGSALQLTMYGVDEYIVQYEAELGHPWQHPDRWIAVSYPFFHADRITTPTLFLGGDQDFNVPLVGGEQMYQALRVLGVPTELVIYPGQFHGLTRPSFKVDRLTRYLDWYAKYLTASSSTARAVSATTSPASRSP